MGPACFVVFHFFLLVQLDRSPVGGAPQDPRASDCFERQNMSFFSLCSFFGFAEEEEEVAAEAVCGRNSSLAFALGPKEVPISCDKLWMLDRLRRCSATMLGSRVLDAPEELR